MDHEIQYRMDPAFYDDPMERIRYLSPSELKEEYFSFLTSEINKDLPDYLDKNLDCFADKGNFDCKLYVTICHKKESCKGCAPFKIQREKVIVYNINHLRKREYKKFEKQLLKDVIEIICKQLRKLELGSFVFNRRVNQYQYYQLAETETETENTDRNGINEFDEFNEKYVNQEGLNYCKSCNYNYPETQVVLRISWAKSSQDYKEDSKFKRNTHLKSAVMLITAVILNWYVYKFLIKYMMGDRGIFKDY